MSNSPLSCFIVSGSVCYYYMLRVYECVFGSDPVLFVWVCMRMTPSPLRERHWAGIVRTTPLLHTTRMRP
jgi:hypothetical protein